MSAKDWLTNPGTMLGLSFVAFLSMTGAVLADTGGGGTTQVLTGAPASTEASTSTTEEVTTTEVTVPQDRTPPSISLDASLYDGIEVGVDHLLVSGLTDPGAHMVIAGVEATADANGVWGRDIALQLGPNVIEVTATDEAGNATGFAITIVYKVSAPAPPVAMMKYICVALKAYASAGG